MGEIPRPRFLSPLGPRPAGEDRAAPSAEEQMRVAAAREQEFRCARVVDVGRELAAQAEERG